MPFVSDVKCRTCPKNSSRGRNFCGRVFEGGNACLSYEKADFKEVWPDVVVDSVIDPWILVTILGLVRLAEWEDLCQ